MNDWKNVELITPRLILRPWREEDAEALYRFASDPEVGPAAGWEPHTSVEYSRNIIRTVLSARETYALVLRYDMVVADDHGNLVGRISASTPVGSVGIMFKGHGSFPHIRDSEAEIGYWMARPLWGRELVPEAVCAIIERCFRELDLCGLWCGYYEMNDHSKRVSSKCGFIPYDSITIPRHPLNGATREYFTYLSRDAWLNRPGPVVHRMTLREAPFRAVESGRKTVEMRLFDYKRRRIRVGDEILFRLDWSEDYVYARVEGIRYVPSFRELYAALLPTHGKAALGYGDNEIPDPADMLDYYSEDMIAFHGVVGIEIALKTPDPLPQNPDR